MFHRHLFRAIPLLSMLLIIGASVLLSNRTERTFAQSGCIWTGVWDTTWPSESTILTLTQNGSFVVGSYDHDEGRVSGTLQGAQLTGTWMESPSYSAPKDAGDYEFTISSNCLTITGRFRFGSTGDWTTWNGTRRGPAPTTTSSTGTPSSSSTPATSTPTSTSTPTATATPAGSWLNGPRGSATCPATGQWLLLYWGGADATTISIAATGCSTADRYWANREGRWLGFSVGLPAASDTWNVATGEAEFIHGK